MPIRGQWILVLLLRGPAFAADVAADPSFKTATLPHYVVKFQSPRLPPNYDIELESIHTRLGFDLALFWPWMLKERVNLYLYKDQQAYAEGEFKPSPWSIGFSTYEDNVVLVYPQADRKRTLEVIAHESTHLYFENYWAEHKGDIPPAWINEGFAMLEESDTRMHPEQSARYRSMLTLPGHEIPLDQFLGTAPVKDLAKADDKPDVLLWYAQAYSIAYYLIRQRTLGEFKDFCDRLRYGEKVEDALKESYKIASLDQFEHDWQKWLREPMLRRRGASSFGSASALQTPDSDSNGRDSMPGLKSGFSTKVH